MSNICVYKYTFSMVSFYKALPTSAIYQLHFANTNLKVKTFYEF